MTPPKSWAQACGESMQAKIDAGWQKDAEGVWWPPSVTESRCPRCGQPWSSHPHTTDAQWAEYPTDCAETHVADVLHDCLSSFQGHNGVDFDREAAVQYLLSPASGLRVLLSDDVPAPGRELCFGTTEAPAAAQDPGSTKGDSPEVQS
jgi:hypothetical protein